MKAYIGIDPGKCGAVAIIREDGLTLAYHIPMIVNRTKKRKKSAKGKTRYSVKTEYHQRAMLALLSKLKGLADDVTVMIEQQRQRPADSKQVVFQIGYGQGLWDMACATLGLTPLKVLPSQWKPMYVELGADKKRSIEECRKLYPKLDLPLAKDEARAEATLIADYALRTEKGLSFPRVPEPKRRKGR